MRERKWHVLAITALAVFAAFLDVTIVNVAFPSIRRTFAGQSLADLSWILNAYNVVFAALLIPAGRASDLFGRRRVMCLGIVAFAVASALCGVAPAPRVLILARVAQAAAAALFVPASLSLLLRAFPAAQRATAVSLWAASGAVAAATGPSLGGVLVEYAGWRWIFYLNVPLGIVTLVATRLVIPESRDPDGAVGDPLSVLLLVGGLGLVALGIVKSGDWTWADTRTLSALGAGALLVVLFAARSRAVRNPVVDLALFRFRVFAVANVANLLFCLAFYALLLCNVLYLTGVWHYTVLRAGVALTPGPLAAAAASGIAGRLCDRHGFRVAAVPGALLFMTGCVLFATRLGATPDYAGQFLPATLLTGSGTGLAFASLSSAAVADLPPALYAAGSGILMTSRQLGAVLGVAVLVAIVGQAGQVEVGTFRHGYLMMVGVSAASAVLATGLTARRQRRTAGSGATAAAAALLLPVLAAQGYRLRRTTPRLPEAADREGLVPDRYPALRLLVVGDSLAAGVGVDSHRVSAAGHLARRLSVQFRRSVSWHVVARNGATVRDVSQRLLPRCVEALRGERPDAVVVMVGINDLVRWRRLGAWRRDLDELIGGVRTRWDGTTPVVVTGLPPIERFPAIPQPLRRVLAGRAVAMGRVLAAATRAGGVAYLPIPADGIGDGGPSMFSADGIHPSAEGYRRLADTLAPVLGDRLGHRSIGAGR
jgi:EmrB/QacA subfamily drug resistance transporter